MNTFQRMFNDEARFELIDFPEPPLQFPRGTQETPRQIALQHLRRCRMKFMQVCHKIGKETFWPDANQKWQWLVYRKYTATQYSQLCNRLQELRAERSCERNLCSIRE